MTITLGENGSANQLRSDLASTASTALGDELVGVKSALTGGTARTQHGKNADTVSVNDFGATGAADDAATFVAAVAASNKKCLRLGGSSYTLDSATLASTPLVGVSDCVIDGEGATITINGATNCGLFSFLNKSNVTIKNINFIGNLIATGAGYLDGTAITFTADSGTSTDLTVTDCTFTNFKGDNWILTGASAAATIQNIRITRNRFTGGDQRTPTSGSVASYCFSVNSPSATQKGIWFSDNYVDCPKLKGAVAVYNLTGVASSDIHIQNNTIRNMGTGYAGTIKNSYGIMVYGAGGNSGVIVTGNTVSAYTCGLYLNEIIDAVVSDNRISSQVETDDSSLMRGGICIGGSRVVCRGNVIDSCAFGIQVQAGSTLDNGTKPADILVDGNVVSAFGVNGVKLRGNTVANNGIKITNNKLDSTIASTVGLFYQFGASVPLNDVEISGNTIAAVTYGMQIGFGNAVTTGLRICRNTMNGGVAPIYLNTQADGVLSDLFCDDNIINCDPATTTVGIALTNNASFNITASCATNQLTVTVSAVTITAGMYALNAGVSAGTTVSSVTNGGVAPCVATLSTSPGTIGSGSFTLVKTTALWDVRNNVVYSCTKASSKAYNFSDCPVASMSGNVAYNCTTLLATGGLTNTGAVLPWYVTLPVLGNFVQKMDAWSYSSSRVQTGWRFNQGNAWLPEWTSSATW